MEFEWDNGNKLKSIDKHGITNQEAESSFLDTGRVLRLSKRGSKTEIRYLCFATSNKARILTSYFLVRNGKIRIIGTRRARKEEKEFYLSKQIK